MFDAPLEAKSVRVYDFDFPWDAEPWNVGLVVGPSGSGKSTVMRHVWGERVPLVWDGDGIVDDFAAYSVEDTSTALGSVGLNTIPAWLRPHRVLSMGEQFRAEMARRILSDEDPIVVDEYTSVVDRQVAQVASLAIGKFVRARKRKFVAVGCHYDVIDWLQPDWVLDMATCSFTRRRLQRRPNVHVVIGRLPRAAWKLFAPFHYMTADLPPATHGFGLWANGRLACSAWLAVFPHPKAKDIVRVARMVTLPDYQGLGLAFCLADALGSALKAGGRRLRNYPAHPAYIEAHKRRPDRWKMISDQEFGPEAGEKAQIKSAGQRFVAKFEYCGEANARFASTLGVIHSLAPKTDSTIYTASSEWAKAIEDAKDASPRVVVDKPMVDGPAISKSENRLSDLPLIQLPPALRADWQPPYHLAGWCKVVESALGGGVRAGCSVPFQHWKSTTTLCGVVWLLLRRPDLRIIVLTHSHEKAQRMGKDLRELWKLAGGTTKKGFDTLEDWQTPDGGGCVVMSWQQSKLGYPCDVLLVDDPLDETEYMIEASRKRADEVISLYTVRAATHLDSVLIVASRWHPYDPIGLRMSRSAVQWQWFQFAGIEGYSDALPGEDLLEHLERTGAKAFAPEILDLRKHVRMRAEWAEEDPSLRKWWAQVQNNPLPDALGFFPGERTYVGAVSGVPMFGVDAAFTAGKKSDYFAMVGGIWSGDSIMLLEGVRHQRGIVEGSKTMLEAQSRHPQCRFVTYASGPEIGIYHAIFETTGISVEVMPARWNKATRAQKAARTWREGKMLVPIQESWTRPYLAEMHAFDGREDGVDDQVDATVALHDAMMMNRPVPGFERGFGFGRPCM